jgi:hypothetical protein
MKMKKNSFKKIQNKKMKMKKNSFKKIEIKNYFFEKNERFLLCKRSGMDIGLHSFFKM